MQWSVRAIYQGYVGWFDGNPSNLNRTAPEEYSRRLVELAGGEQAVSEAVKKALTESEFQWAAELCDLLLGAGDAVSKDAGDNARRWKAGSLRELARLETSANGRHYYLSCAKRTGYRITTPAEITSTGTTQRGEPDRNDGFHPYLPIRFPPLTEFLILCSSI